MSAPPLFAQLPVAIEIETAGGTVALGWSAEEMPSGGAQKG